MFTFLGAVVVISALGLFLVWWCFFGENKELSMSNRHGLLVLLLMGLTSVALSIFVGMLLAMMIGAGLPVHNEKIGTEECGDYVIETYEFAFDNWKHYLIGFPPQGITRIVVSNPS